MKLALLVAAWLAGIYLGLRFDAALLPLFLLIAAALIAGLLLRLGRVPVWPAVLSLILLTGLLRVESTESLFDPQVTAENQTVTLTGRIVDDPEATAQRIKFVLAVENIDRGQGRETLRGKALVYAEPPPSLVSLRNEPYFRYGDTLRLQGQMQLPRPLEEFDYPAYLASQGIFAVLWTTDAELLSQESGLALGDWRGWIFGLRGHLSRSIERAMPVPQSALARALLLGIRGQLPPDVVQDFRGTGTSHLLAISGLHVGVLLAMSMMLSTGLLGRRHQVYLLLPLISIWLYALVSGLPVSVVRAAIMGTVFLAALALGRPKSALPALALSAGIMVGISPRILEQVSFQLSFAALVGIILAQPFQAKVFEDIPNRAGLVGTWWQAWRWQGTRWLLTALVVSLAATLATWPLVAFNFDQIPLLGIFATLLALPALPFILLGSLITGVAGLAHPLLGQFFGWITWVPVSYVLSLVSVVPPVTLPGSWVGAPLLWVWYGVLGALLLLPGGRSRIDRMASVLSSMLRPAAAGRSGTERYTGFSLGFVGLASAMLVAAVVLWMQVLQGSDGRLHVFFFDVGQGDSVLIVTPGGRQVLVDGGPGAETATRALSTVLRPGDRSLDLVVVTHMDGDHSRGLLEVLDRYRVGMVLTGVVQPGGPIYPRWQAALKEHNVKTRHVESGFLVELEPGIVLEVLNPPPVPVRGSNADDNNNAVVLRLVHDQISYLLASDIEAFAENNLVRQSIELRSTVLKVPHHGSRTSTTVPFLHRVRPSLGVISSGAGNQFGHPHPEVVERLERISSPEGVFRTDRDGTIEFISDGRNLWVRTEGDAR
ncbi:MAG: ComEC/Rec2 family competence protein [Chloroflexi bacterium]|nr:ComEC/Rec2 family competence protein [Chloroflexota bacterium]